VYVSSFRSMIGETCKELLLDMLILPIYLFSTIEATVETSKAYLIRSQVEMRIILGDKI
jgi:hypothetical protein